MELLGVDTGGTFTDFVLFKEGKIRVHKVLSTPSSPAKAILQGIKELELDLNNLKVIHGSTVATNAVLEGKGVKTVYVTNQGLRDVLLIGRQARQQLYNLQPVKEFHPVKRELCLEVDSRVSANGETIEALSQQSLDALLAQIKSIKPASVAINLLFSFLDDSVEKKIESALPLELFVSRSSAILPEYKEYERGMTTWLNAYVGPLVKNYLQQLEQAIAPAKLSVMLSAGGTANVDYAGNHAVHMLLSGPAGGLQAARFVGKQLGCNSLLTFDMGGTSTDVALIDGEIKLTSEAKIAELPIAIPMVDMHTIGAGGGSIAYVDKGGLLQVGPESAGASPGPACYGAGGEQATVTDANVVLGRLPSDMSLGGSLALNRQASVQAMEKLARLLNCSVEEVAEGILDIANEHMVRALRMISVQKGVDPRGFSLVSFGGAGGLHVCDLAESMGMSKAIVPLNAGVFSAFGMLVAPVSRELSCTYIGVLSKMDVAGLEAEYARLVKKGIAQLLEEGVDEGQITSSQSMDLRYQGQSFSLNIPWSGIEETLARFHATHLKQNGHILEANVELINLRVSLKAQTGSLNLDQVVEKYPEKANDSVFVHNLGKVPVLNRLGLVDGQQLDGPVLIVEDVATTLIKPNWQCRVVEGGHLNLSRR